MEAEGRLLAIVVFLSPDIKHPVSACLRGAELVQHLGWKLSVDWGLGPRA